jgi:TonB family protein
LVNNKGAVTDITVIHSTNSAIFNKSAIKALKQWQYDVNSLKIVTEAPIKHEVQFDFSLNKQ